MPVSSVPLSETHITGRPREAMMVSSSRTTRNPGSEVSGTNARHSRVKSSTIASFFGVRLTPESGRENRRLASELWGSDIRHAEDFLALWSKKRPRQQCQGLAAQRWSITYLDLSDTQAVLSLSYLKPGADFKASFVVSMVRYVLLFFVVCLTALNGTATSFSPAPRKPPTPTGRPC